MFSDDTARSWSDLSFDFKGMFVYHIAMMVMMIAGARLAFIEQIAIAGAIAASIAAASLVRRLRHKWRWKGLTPLRAGGALLLIALMGYFLFAAAGGALQAPSFAIDRPFGFGPWVLAGLGIAVFSVLNVLRITYRSERAFLEDCGERQNVPLGLAHADG